MRRFFQLALAATASWLLIHQYPEIRRYFKMTRM